MKNMANETASHLNGSAKKLAKNLKDQEPMVTEALEHFTEVASVKAQEFATQFAGQAKDAYAAGRSYAKSNPVKALVISTVAGAVVTGLIGMFLRKKR